MKKSKKIILCSSIFALLMTAAFGLTTGCGSKNEISPSDLTESAAPAPIEVVRVHPWENTKRNREITGSFRHQLVDDEVDIYDAMVKHYLVEKRYDELPLNLKMGYASTYHADDVFDIAWSAFLYDHPEVFWVTTPLYQKYDHTWTDDYITVSNATISPKETYPGAFNDIETVFNGIDKAVEEISANRKSESRYDTVKEICNYICMNAKYDYEAYDDTNPVTEDMFASFTVAPVFGGGSRGKKVVCVGYSHAMTVLCTRFDIPCVSRDNMRHTWNNVQMEDGKWYAVDITWLDDDLGDGYTLPSSYPYFLVGKNTDCLHNGNTFEDTHTSFKGFGVVSPDKDPEEEEYGYPLMLPVLADDQYTPAQ